MSAKAEEKIAPVDPARFHQALGIYQAALVAKDPEGAALIVTSVVFRELTDGIRRSTVSG